MEERKPGIVLISTTDVNNKLCAKFIYTTHPL